MRKPRSYGRRFFASMGTKDRSLERSRRRGSVQRWTAFVPTFAALAVLVEGGTAAPPGAPANTSPPVVSGTAKAGQLFQADRGGWKGNPVDFSYAWSRCDSSQAICKAIPDATDRIYAVGTLDVGRALQVAVVAKNSAGAASAASKPTPVIVAGPRGAPISALPPTISGKPRQGEVLTVRSGGWEGVQPISFEYRWRLCDAVGGNCTTTGVAGATYRLSGKDLGHSLRILIKARNKAGSSFALSDPSAKVRPTQEQTQGGAPKSTSPPSVSGLPQEGETLTASTGSWTGAQPLHFSFQWEHCESNNANCLKITGATDKLYTTRAADVGSRLRIVVTARNSQGSAFGTSASTPVVTSHGFRTGQQLAAGDSRDDGAGEVLAA